MVKIGQYLKDRRVRVVGLSQYEVARACGVKEQSISKIENGRSYPSNNIADRYAKTLLLNKDVLIRLLSHATYSKISPVDLVVSPETRAMLETKMHVDILLPQLGRNDVLPIFTWEELLRFYYSDALGNLPLRFRVRCSSGPISNIMVEVESTV